MYKKVCLLILVLVWPISLAATTRVVTSTTDLAYFAREIGGEYVEVQSIASPTADVHFIEIRPSFMRKVAQADVVLKVGLELDLWMDRIIDGSRNNRLVVVDCSENIQALEVPSFKADARYGDLHRFGNPHYWLGPQNVEPITDAIVRGLTSADPGHAEEYHENRQRLLSEITAALEGLKPKLQRLEGIEVVFYHNSWPYFNEYTGLKAAGFVEPYPGVPPSPAHVAEITGLVASRAIRLIAIEPYYDQRVPNKIAGATEAKVVVLYPSVGGRTGGETYFEWLEGNIDALLGALP